MTHFEGDWKTVPEFVLWIDSVNAWVDLFGIYAQIPADSLGEDSSGIIESLDSNLVWTEQEGNGPDVIVPEVLLGDWGSGGVQGWFVGTEMRQRNTRLNVQTMLEIDCQSCGNGELDDPSDCDACEEEGVVWLRLEDIGFHIPAPATFEELQRLKEERTQLANPMELDLLLEKAISFDRAGYLDLAVCLWEKAAELGSARAMFNLGDVAKAAANFEACESWWIRAAQLGNTDASFSLGVLFKDRANITDAMIWWKRAEALGDEGATKAIEVTRSLGLDPDFPVDVNQLSIPQLNSLAYQYNKWEDSDKVLFYLQKSADLGDLEALNDLALEISRRGDEEKSRLLLTKAAEAGHSVAMLNLGGSFAKESRFADAKEWWRRAAELGNLDAKRNLELMSTNGDDPDLQNGPQERKMATTTAFENKAGILAELWTDYRNDESFADFIEYNDLGLPLAYAYANGLIDLQDKAKSFVEEAFALLLDNLDLRDTGFETLEQILKAEN